MISTSHSDRTFTQRIHTAHSQITLSTMSDIKKSFKPCAVCNCRPQDIGDVTFGEFNENGSRWYCFEHVNVLWKSANPNIKNTSDWWNHLEKVNGVSPRPR